MKELKASCITCYYGGSLDPTKLIATCKCEDRKDRFLVQYHNHREKDFCVEIKNNQEIECDFYIPCQEEYELEPVTSFDLFAKCPYCGAEDTHYDVGGQGTKLIDCEECEKQYYVHYNIY